MRTLRSISAPLALTLALFAGACNRDGDDAAMTQDTALNRDLELANRDTAVPTLNDAPAPTTAEPAPAASAPTRTAPRSQSSTATRRAPAPAATRETAPAAAAAPAARTGEIAAGSKIVATADGAVCTNTSQVGQTFTATVSEDVQGTNGVVIPAGAKVTLEVTRLAKKTSVRDDVVIDLKVNSIAYGGRTYEPNARVTPIIDKTRSTTRGQDAKKVGAGAAIGAAIGGITQKSAKGAIIGAAAGAAAGTAAAAATGDYEGCVNVGNRVTLTLDQGLTVRA